MRPCLVPSGSQTVQSPLPLQFSTPPLPPRLPPPPLTPPLYPPPLPQVSLKKRRSLLGAVVAKQAVDVVAQGKGDSLLDSKVSAEVERFEQIRLQVLAKVLP